MINRKLSSADYQIFLLKSLAWLGFAGLGFALALFGFFYASIAWTGLIVGGLLLTRFVFKKKIIVGFSPELYMVTALIVSIVVIFSIFSTPTVFSGRDQGSISEAAIRLAQNHKLEFSTPASTEFFKIYGPGRALNFPGFYYTKQGNLITQFPLVYIVWLALFYAVFGITGFIIANALLLILFFLSFYLLLRMFLGVLSASVTTLFAATSFVFMWFSKFTLSENMALSLLWLTLLSLMLFIKSRRKLHLITFLTAASLLFFTRIEGIAFLIVAIAIVIFNKNTRDFIKEKILSRFFLPIAIFTIAFILNAFRDINFYKEIAKALLPSLFKTFQAKSIITDGDVFLPHFYLGKIFWLYGLLGFFIVAAIAIIIYLWKKERYKLVPFLVVLPTCIYFFHAYISQDQPWMLRRFAFSLLPIAIFYSGMILGEWFEKSKNIKIKILSGTIAIMLIADNLPAFSNYLTFTENKNLLSQTQALGKNFSDNDLILIDQQTSGDGWAMISGPLSSIYGKNSAYFFNTNDLKRLGLEKFDKIFLIAPDKQTSYYANSTIGNRLVFKNNYNFTYSKLAANQNASFETILLPEKKETTVSGKIFEIAK